MDAEEFADRIDKSFRDAVFSKTRIIVHEILFDGAKPKMSEIDILRWCARRSKQETDIADLCMSINRKDGIDEQLRSEINNQERQEREHAKMLDQLVRDSDKAHLVSFTHATEPSKEWSAFVDELKSEDPLPAIIRLEYGHEVFSDAGFEEMFYLPYKSIIDVLRRIAKDEREHGGIGRIALIRYIETTGNPLEAKDIVGKYRSDDFISAWFFTFWN